MRSEPLQLLLDHLLLGLDAQPELAHHLRPGELAAVVVHRPRATEGEARTAVVGIEPLAGAALELVGSAAPLRGDPELGELVGEEGVEVVGGGLLDAVPHHDADHDESGTAEMAGAVFHDYQILLVHAGSSDYLNENR